MELWDGRQAEDQPAGGSAERGAASLADCLLPRGLHHPEAGRWKPARMRAGQEAGDAASRKGNADHAGGKPPLAGIRRKGEPAAFGRGDCQGNGEADENAGPERSGEKAQTIGGNFSGRHLADGEIRGVSQELVGGFLSFLSFGLLWRSRLAWVLTPMMVAA